MCCEAIPRRRDALPETVGDVVGAEEVYEDVRQVERHEGEHRTRGRREDIVLETHKRTVAALKGRAGVACAGRYGAMKWSVPTAATKGSLQYDPSTRGVPGVPRFANLCIKRNFRLFVGDVADRDVGNGCGKEQVYVDREDRPRVQKRSSYTHQRGKQK